MINKFEIGDALTSSNLNSARVKYVCPEDFYDKKVTIGTEEIVLGWSDAIKYALKYAVENNLEFKCEGNVYEIEKPIIIDFNLENYTKKINFDCEIKASKNFSTDSSTINYNYKYTEIIKEDPGFSTEEANIGIGASNYLFIFRPTSYYYYDDTTLKYPGEKIINQNFYFKKLSSGNSKTGGILIQPITLPMYAKKPFVSYNSKKFVDDKYNLNSLAPFSFNKIEIDRIDVKGISLCLDATYGIITTSTFKGLRWHSSQDICVEMKIDKVSGENIIPSHDVPVGDHTIEITDDLNKHAFLTSINFYDVEFYTGTSRTETQSIKPGEDNFNDNLHPRKNGSRMMYRGLSAWTGASVRQRDYGSMTEIHYTLNNVNLESCGGIYHKNNVVQSFISGVRLTEQASESGWLYLDWGEKPEGSNYNQNTVLIKDIVDNITSNKIIFHFDSDDNWGAGFDSTTKGIGKVIDHPAVKVASLLNGSLGGGIIGTNRVVKLNNPKEMVKAEFNNNNTFNIFQEINVITNPATSQTTTGFLIKKSECLKSFILNTKVLNGMNGIVGNSNNIYIILPESLNQQIYNYPVQCLVNTEGLTSDINLRFGRQYYATDENSGIYEIKTNASSNKNFQLAIIKPNKKYLIEFYISSGLVNSSSLSTTSYCTVTDLPV